MNNAKSTDKQNQEDLTQTNFGAFILFISISPMSFPTLTDILNIPIGELTKGVTMASVYIMGSVIAWWHWKRLRASIGLLFFSLALSVLVFIGVKNNLPAMVAFFGSLLVGFGLIVSEGLSEVENRHRNASS